MVGVAIAIIVIGILITCCCLCGSSKSNGDNQHETNTQGEIESLKVCVNLNIDQRANFIISRGFVLIHYSFRICLPIKISISGYSNQIIN